MNVFSLEFKLHWGRPIDDRLPLPMPSKWLEDKFKLAEETEGRQSDKLKLSDLARERADGMFELRRLREVTHLYFRELDHLDVS